MTIDTQTDTPTSDVVAPRILLVDDEANILTALRRLFRPLGYQVFTAGGGKEGLALMEDEPIDVVISDMRMPEMNGAQFLKAVHERWPDTVRVLLTGYADVQSTVDAINQGQIYRYIAKPWEDQDMLMAVRQALDYRNLVRERGELLVLTRQQNEQLKVLNAGLESQVKARTAELEQTVLFLEQTQEKLKQSFQTVLKVFSNLLELRHGSLAGHAGRVGELARRVARKLKMNEYQQQEVWVAGLLHGIGKIGLPDSVLGKPYDQMTPDERTQFTRHPIKGQMALTPIEDFAGAARIIRHQHERFDGRGFPDNLAGEDIPLGARILTAILDFEMLRGGLLTGRPLPPNDALGAIKRAAGQRYDGQVIAALEAVLAEPDALLDPNVRQLPVAELKPGMRLAEDLRSMEGVLLLARDHVLSDAQIQQITRFERSDGKPYRVAVRVE